MAWRDIISEQKLLRELYEEYEAIRAYIGGWHDSKIRSFLDAAP
jgi:hypothetical protein